MKPLNGLVLTPFMIAAAMAGCASTTPVLDPFERPYRAANQMAPRDIRLCTPTPLDKYPRLLSGTRPMYPIGEMMAGRTGEAVVQFRVSTTGELELLSQESENRWFAAHAAIAMRDWKLAPAELAGKPVTATCKLSFKLMSPAEAKRRGIDAP